MVVRKIKPNHHAQRGMSVIDFKQVLTKSSSPVKSLVFGGKSTAGRSNGKISSRFRGGGVKQLQRIVDFKQTKLAVPATVKTIEYDPNRSAFIALLVFADGQKTYILAPQNLNVGDKIIYNYNTKIKVGNRLQLKNIPTGIAIHNIELQPGKGGQIVRGAGGSAIIAGFDKGYAQIKLPSSELRLIPEEAFASVGIVSNPDHSNLKIGKAGRKRLMGIRPHVRGKAMNPVDHPHGGGEGNTSIGLKHAKTPWGKTAMGVKTRSNKATDKYIIKRRTHKKKK